MAWNIIVSFYVPSCSSDVALVFWVPPSQASEWSFPVALLLLPQTFEHPGAESDCYTCLYMCVMRAGKRRKISHLLRSNHVYWFTIGNPDKENAYKFNHQNPPAKSSWAFHHPDFWDPIQQSRHRLQYQLARTRMSSGCLPGFAATWKLAHSGWGNRIRRVPTIAEKSSLQNITHEWGRFVGKSHALKHHMQAYI